MSNVNDICDYVILKAKSDEDIPLNNLKLQKLLFYIQAWYLVFYNRPLFSGKFQAWVHGPVNREIYDRFRKTKSLYSDITKEDVINNNCEEGISSDDKLHIDNVLDVYLKCSGVQLEALTHSEDPWIKARTGYSNFSNCEVEIDEKLMGSYYKSKLHA